MRLSRVWRRLSRGLLTMSWFAVPIEGVRKLYLKYEKHFII